MVECLQNLARYGRQEAITRYDHSVFVISRQDDSYSISTGNYVGSGKVNSPANKLEAINSMDTDELKMLFKQIIQSSYASEGGGAGLGLIDIARKSGNKLNYQFFDVNDEFHFFVKKTNVDLEN